MVGWGDGSGAHWLLAPFPNNRGGREVTEARGKKSKKVKWNLSLGLKDVVFAGLGVAGLMMMSFALGTLAGRGDIYRVLHNWGLLGPEASRAMQHWPHPGGGPPMTPAAQAPPTQAAVVPGSPAPPTAAGKTPEPAKAPAASPPSASQKKTAKSANLAQKHKEDELRRLREEVARKLKFQNSLDTGGAKPARPAAKQKAKETDKAASAKSPQNLVKVAQFRDKKAAQAKVAALQKQGEKASLKEGKDQQGTYYTVYRQGSEAAKATGQSTVKNREKTGGAPANTNQTPEQQ